MSEPRRAPLLPIFLIVLVDVLGLTIVIPLLALYAETFGASPLMATLLLPTFAVCQLVSGPLLGRISDRTGRKPMLLISQAGTLLGFILMAKATALWMVFVARVLDGATAGNLSLAQAYISDHTRPEERAKSFALIGIAFGLGFLVGPAITSWLSGFGMSTPIWAAAALSATSILATALLLPSEKGERSEAPADAAAPGGKRLAILDWGAYAGYFARPVLAGLLLQFLAYMFAFSTFTGGFALFAERRFTWHDHPFTVREIGLVFAYSGVLGIIIQGGLIGRMVKRFGEGRIVAAGFLAIAVGNVLLGFSESITLLIVAATISSFGNSVLRPALTSLVTQRAARTEQGVVIGLTQSLSSLAAIAAPPLAGWLIEHDLLTVWGCVAGGCALLGLLLSPLGALHPPSPPAEAAQGA